MVIQSKLSSTRMHSFGAAFITLISLHLNVAFSKGPLPTIVNATVGREVKLPCRFKNVQGDSSSSWWTRNGTTLRKTSKYRIKPFRYLKIRKVEKSDAGEYICWAKNENGERQRSINLNVIDPHHGKSKQDIAPYFTNIGRMKRKYLLIPAGHDAKIVCSADGSPKPTVTWYKDGKKLKYMPDGFTLLTPNTFIITFDVLKPGHSGKYKCVVSNEFGSISEEYTVKVKEIMITKPITQSMKNITAYEGDNVTITCKAISDSLPHFQWLIVRPNGSLEVLDPGLYEEDYIWKGYNDRWHGVNLLLVNVTQEDEREYVCMVGDDRGYDFQKFQLKVVPRPITTKEIEISKPVLLPMLNITAYVSTKPITQPMRNITAYEGDNVTITCKAISDSLPHFQWLTHRPNGPLEVLDPGLSKEDSTWKSDSDRWHGVKLRLVNVTQEDGKEYVCMVGNDLGCDFQKFHLKVIPRPTSPQEIEISKPVVLPMQNITAYEGENVTITCKAANNLVPHFQWAVQRPNGSIEILDSKSRQFSPKSGNDGLYAENLRLINIKREDEKVYYCMVGDDGGYDFQTVHLRVLPRPVTSEGSIQVG